MVFVFLTTDQINFMISSGFQTERSTLNDQLKFLNSSVLNLLINSNLVNVGSDKITNPYRYSCRLCGTIDPLSICYREVFIS